MNDIPSHIHFFSWATRISIELPVGFEEAAADEAERYAVYADDLDEDDPPGARVQTRLSVLPDDRPDAHAIMADAAVSASQAEIQSRQELVLDHLPAVEQTLRYRDESGEDRLRHDAYIHAGDIVFSVVAVTDAERAGEYLPAFRAAVRSVRLILV